MTDQPLRDREDAEPVDEPAGEHTDAQVDDTDERDEGATPPDE